MQIILLLCLSAPISVLMVIIENEIFRKFIILENHIAREKNCITCETCVLLVEFFPNIQFISTPYDNSWKFLECRGEEDREFTVLYIMQTDCL